MLKVSSHKVTYSETRVKSYNNKYNHKNNNGYEFEDVKNKGNKEETKSKIETLEDRHFDAPSVEVKNTSADNTSEIYKSLLLSLLRKGKNEVTSQRNSSDFANNKVLSSGNHVKLLNMNTSLKGINHRTDINFQERVSVKVTGNLLEKLVRDKPQTSLANEKSRGNNQESRVKLFVTDKPFRLMPLDTSQLTSYSDKNTTSISALSKIHSSDFNVTLPSPINYFLNNNNSKNNNDGYDIGSVNKNDERQFSTRSFNSESDRINETNVTAGTATTYSSLAISALEINEETMENSVTAITIKDNKNIGRIIKKQEFEINTRLSANSNKANWEIKSMLSPKSINRRPFISMEILRHKKSSNLMNTSDNKTMSNVTFGVSADETESNGITENISETILRTDEKRLPSHLRNLGRPSELLNPLDLLNSTSLSVESGTEARNSLPPKDISTEAGNPQSSEINGSIHESTTHPLHARNSGTFHQTDSDPGYYGENVAFNDYRLQASRPLTVTEFTTEISQVERAKMGIDLLSNETKTTPLGNTKASGTKAMDKSALSSSASTSRRNDSQIFSEKWEHGSLLPPSEQPNANQTINDVNRVNAGSTISSTSAKRFGEQTGKIGTNHQQSGINANNNLTYSQNNPGVAGARATGFDKVGMNENSSSVAVNQWPVKHSAIVEGDLVLGGLMMVHEREDTITCGPVMPQGGVQALEAMLFTLDWLSKRQFIPGVKIGAHILDDCDKDTYGLEMAVDFIKGSISNIDGAEYHCNKSTVRKVISGVVGAASSVTSIQVANLLRLFRIPQVSFFSTSPELSNKQRFEYFTRTIPSDHYQVKAMVDIIKVMNWSYVSIIYEESNYGIKAYEELEELLAKYQICIAIKEKLVKDSGVAEEIAYDNIVQKLLTKPRARGCIIFGSDQEVAEMMRAVRRNNATGAFYWIGSDGWSARGLVSNKNEAEVEGTLSVQPQANPVVGFEEYFLNLTVENNRRNPWFVEFWEDHFQCRYPNSSLTPYNKKYKTACTTKERLTKQNTAFEDQLQFVSDAVMAFAYAFRDMHDDLCHGELGLCDAMKPTKGTELLKYLRKVEFKGLSGDKFHFDKNGDGPARYNIIHFKQVSPGKYKWVRVGKYLEGELRLNMSEIQFRMENSETPESVCSLPCRIGQAKKYVEGESCCWHCFDCTQYQIRHPDDQTRCIQCPQGTVPDETHSYCRDIPEEFLKFDSAWAIGAMTFSTSGILVTLFVGGVFLKHNDTPIVRASGRELSYVLLTGILLCYLVTFTLILKPTDIVCGIQRFSAGFCFTVVYAALLTKTNRISRIFNKSKRSAKRPSFISPRSQLIICSLLVGVQILINIVWMAIDPAKARHHYPTREDNLLVCNSYIDASYMIAFTYPIILIIVCTVYAVLTRKIPEDFNESKHIGFTMYTTCVIWLAFVPLYFGTGNHVALRITSMSVTISLSASVTIACLFSPKLYIILIHPERNIRRGRGPFAAPKHSTVARTNASSMISTVTLTAVTCDQNKAIRGHSNVTTNDCSTQSEKLKDCKNGKPGAGVTRSTQTALNNNETTIISPEKEDNKLNELGSVKSLNNIKMGNGPGVNKKDVAL
ncbi:metabotropic glutamate receptor 2-like isoform X2 [Microplitis mediator]|uniref:metabotropic glutamate receptor 2-like isoform X2 n=1 Tax=Microplitis mediator TaxID=375433 RepID=UPI0025574DDA|nr:metabotropic glutamate receptor 2-like isoform X2 [Microplitis mediator]